MINAYVCQVSAWLDRGGAAWTDAGALYRRVLGSRAAWLPGPVAAVHCGSTSVRVAGWMRVERGSSWLSRLVATVARLPRAAPRVWTQLTIDRRGGDERWTRRFGDSRAVCSRQAAGSDGELVEHIGVFAFAFVLDATEQGLGFRQQAFRVRLGGLSVRVPAALEPHVDAAVVAAADGGVVVSVRVDAPGVGPVLAYDGTVAIEGVGA